MCMCDSCPRHVCIQCNQLFPTRRFKKRQDLQTCESDSNILYIYISCSSRGFSLSQLVTFLLSKTWRLRYCQRSYIFQVSTYLSLQSSLSSLPQALRHVCFLHVPSPNTRACHQSPGAQSFSSPGFGWKSHQNSSCKRLPY